MTYRWIFGVSIITIVMSIALAISYFSKGADDWKIWAQQSFLWIGLFAGYAGHILKVLEKRISKLEKQLSKSGSV